ncbi:MAG: RNA polymerase sigma factor RpoH [Gammaproteobacteria bacterium]|mgnify:CR=1 FL=1|nr:RNA polymerase sigma factor RpoH [Gammaproteobacteria bacterium]|tara:strand:- start:9411 stop:10244 length:834 start_codon:yes stop_codon:yes gene_type:complete
MIKENYNLSPISVGSTDTYISHVMSLPILTKEEEILLGQRLNNSNDLDAAKKLIMHNLRYVVYIARSYTGYGLNLNDLIQEGNVGLMKAVKKFNPEKEVRLITFAVHWIKSEIHEFVLKNWKIVKVATTKAQRKLFFNLRSKKSSQLWLSKEETIKIANDLDVPIAEVNEMESRLSNYDLALDPSSDDEFDSSPSSYLQSQEPSPEIVYEKENSIQKTKLLHEAIKKLDSRSQDIIVKRWLSDNKSTLEDLSKEYGISRERVRQIESESILKLKKVL